MDATSCERECNKFGLCVGYFHETGANKCYLFPSSHYCPSNEWTQFNGDVALISSQLVVTKNAGNCKAKRQEVIVGNISIIFLIDTNFYIINLID